MSSLDQLIHYLQKLRDTESDTGCAWTKAQDFYSLAPQTLDECYELVDAIAQGNQNEIKSELGDLLYHIIFYAQMAEEQGQFSFQDIAQTILDKHERRLPNQDKRANLNAEEVNAHWDSMKAKELSEQSSILDGITQQLPGFNYATKLQNRAAQVGFDWPDVNYVFEKLTEESAELQLEVKIQANKQRLEDELGDIIFTCVNLARHLNINPEMALRAANRKFEARFRRLEKNHSNSPQSAKSLAELALDELEALWHEAKITDD